MMTKMKNRAHFCLLHQKALAFFRHRKRFFFSTGIMKIVNASEIFMPIRIWNNRCACKAKLKNCEMILVLLNRASLLFSEISDEDTENSDR
jgi:hypothetical protein